MGREQRRYLDISALREGQEVWFEYTHLWGREREYRCRVGDIGRSSFVGAVRSAMCPDGLVDSSVLPGQEMRFRFRRMGVYEIIPREHRVVSRPPSAGYQEGV